MCFNCDQKFSRGHKCSSKLFLLIVNEGDIPPDDLLLTDWIHEKVEADAQSPAQISLHALSNHITPEALRSLGRISNHQVWILIDGGSTHNFIQEHLVTDLGLPTQPTQSLRVMVGNGHGFMVDFCPSVMWSKPCPRRRVVKISGSCPHEL